MRSTEPLSFVPSRVEGLDGVTLVTIHPDRMVFDLSDSTRTFLFRDLGRSVGSAFERIADLFRFEQDLK